MRNGKAENIQEKNAVKRRRRNDELENAILNVAWQELLNHGYAGLTLAGVASSASTSRTVLARRWNNKADLAVAAVNNKLNERPFCSQDLGSIRLELLDYLQRLCDLSDIITIVFSMLLDTSFRETYASPQTLREALMRGRHDVFSQIITRAIKRGEINSSRLTATVTPLLNDLVGQYVLLNRQPPSPKLCAAWVDEIFIPLVQA